jgi:serine/threonine-protein kinase
MLTIEEIRDTKFVLPADVVLAPVEQLSANMKRLLDARPRDFTYTRRYARGGTKVISEAAGLLLENFRAPSTFLDAIVSFGRSIGRDPLEVFDSASQMLISLIEQDCLAPENSETSLLFEPTLATESRFEDMEIVACCQLLQDTEVYRARDADGAYYAVKIVRSGQATPFILEMFEREKLILEHIGGGIAPKLKASGSYNDRPFLVMEWIEGMSLDQVVFVLRKTDLEASGKEALADRLQTRYGLAQKVLDAYAVLHEKGVVHGDVHSRNILVGPDGEVKLIDFGFARILADEETYTPRAGVSSYYDPEYADSLLYGFPPPDANPLGEQYSIAVVVYEILGNDLIANGYYLPATADRDEQLKLISESKPLPLASYLSAIDERVEACVMRALSKDPTQRHPSVEILCKLFAEASEERIVVAPHEQRRGTGLIRSQAQEYVNEFIRLAQPEGRWFSAVFDHSPSCSIKYGAAGIAYTLYRMALLREDSQLLERADLWIAKAIARQTDEHAFYSRTIDIDRASVGPVSPYHTPSGLYLVQALVCDAMGEVENSQRALNAFAELCEREECHELDLTLGKTAVLLGAAIALEHFKSSAHIDLSRIESLGDRSEEAVWSKLNELGDVAVGSPLTYLGMAHGWAGYCYGSMRWTAAKGTQPRQEVRGRLEELLEMSEAHGKGVKWRAIRNESAHMSGWCNGHAGWVFLWSEAARTYQDERYLTLMEASALSVWNDRRGISSICCGAAGKSYALLDLYRVLGDKLWLRRAERVLQIGLDAGDTGYSLYKSMTGVALLASDMEAPEVAAMPLFERECPNSQPLLTFP